MQEKDFQTRLTRWARHHITRSCAIEAKLTKGRRLPITALKPHQNAALQLARNGTLVYKIPDVGINQKPFDMVVMSRCDAFVAAMFYEPGTKHFYLIPIANWNDLATDHRSLLESDLDPTWRRELA